MPRPRYQVVPAAYVALTRPGSAGDSAVGEVLLQLRQGTRFMDGWWACAAAGHVEWGETALQAAAREAREEIGVEVQEVDLAPLATVHRACVLHDDPVEERMDLFFTTDRWRGEPRVAEPEKSAELRWWPLADLPERVVPHERKALTALAQGRFPTFLTHGFDQRLTLVAAVGRNGAIGDGSGMPWHLPEDLAHFKRTTMGGTMVMGRGTWDSIGRALPGRRTIVVTRDRDWSAPGAEVAHSVPEALLMADEGEVFIAGGGQLYAQTIGAADRLVITEVDQSPAVPVRFPDIDPDRWQEVSRLSGEGLQWVEWRRYGSRATVSR